MHTLALTTLSWIVLAAAISPALSGSPLAEQPREAAPVQQALPFDGTWEGTIKFDQEGFLSDTGTPAAVVTYRIEISGSVVRVFLEMEGEFKEIGAGEFHIAPVLTNAVIFGTGADDDNWVETIVFAVTQRDKDTLIVQFSRVVNNRRTPLEDKESKFATRGSGTLVRAKVP